MWSRYLKLYAGTKAEQALEPALAKAGVPYRWQMPFWRYILDFAWPGAKVAIEIDGASHRKPAQIEKDKTRTAYLESKGWRVLRTTNEAVMADPEGVVKGLLKEAGLDGS